MSWYRNLRMTPKIVLPVGLMLIVALGLLTWQIQSRSSAAMRAAAERELAALAGEKGNAVKSIFEVALNESQALAGAVKASMDEGFTPSREQLLAMLKGLQQSNSQFMAAGSAWEPNAYDGNDAQYKGAPGHDPQGRFQPYLAKGVPLEPLQNLETSSYYSLPKKLKASVITEPYEYEVDGKKILMLTASSVIMQKKRLQGRNSG